MSQSISRRGFLKGSAAAAAGAAAAGLALPQAVRADGGGRRLATLLDLSKCIGCEACVEACRDEWQDGLPEPVEPMPRPIPSRVPIEDWSRKKDVQNRLTPYNFLYVEMLELEHKGQTLELNIPRRCMHCDNPPCVNLCPFGAGRQEENGIVHIDEEVCLGGAKCKQVCPWHIPQRQSGTGIYLDILPTLAGNGVMFKCTRCLPLVAQGQTPRCISVCPEKVQSIGPKEQMLQKAQELARAKARADGASEDQWMDYVYGIEENGGTTTFYVSPVPFSEVAQAVDAQHKQQAKEELEQGVIKQPKNGGKIKMSKLGRPPMRPVANSMANEENLAKALAIAPLAGLAAGLVKFLGKGGDSSSKGGE